MAYIFSEKKLTVSNIDHLYDLKQLLAEDLDICVFERQQYNKNIKLGKVVFFIALVLFALVAKGQNRDAETERKIKNSYNLFFAAYPCAPCGLSFAFKDSTYTCELLLKVDPSLRGSDSLKVRCTQMMSGLYEFGAMQPYKKCTGVGMSFWTGTKYYSYKDFFDVKK